MSTTMHMLLCTRNPLPLCIIKSVSRPFATSSNGNNPPQQGQKGSHSCIPTYSAPNPRRNTYIEWPYAIYASDRITDRKSVFLAHASTLSSRKDLPILLSQLERLPRMKRATHCMYAYRTREEDGGSGKLVCEQSDGGEGGSGERLSRLLELARYENVVVVVWRWYGGVQLGSDRWKRISDAAKAALKQGQFKNNK